MRPYTSQRMQNPNPESADIEMESEDYNLALGQMNGADLETDFTDYTESLHFKVNKALRNKQILPSLGETLGLRPANSAKFECAIKFGETKLEDYHNIAELGKGTYGEVNKCIHSKSNTIVAVKTFFFEVSLML